MTTPPTTLPPEPVSPTRGEETVWMAWDVVFLVAVAGIAYLAFAFAVTAIASRLPAFRNIPFQELAKSPEFLYNPFLVLPIELGVYLSVLGLMFALARSHSRKFWEAVRWNWPRHRWIAYFGFGIALSIAIQLASALLPAPKNLPIERYFRGTSAAWLLAIFATTVAPLMEELFFRGFLYPVLTRRLSQALAILVTAAAFAFIHESQLAHAWSPLLMIFIVGLTLTTVRARTRSVASSFLIHAGYNATIFVLLYFGTDHFRHMERMGTWMAHSLP